MAKSIINVNGVYLLGALYKGDVKVKDACYFPLPNVCFAHKNEDKKVYKISYDANGKQQLIPDNTPLLYSDQYGKITNFTAPTDLSPKEGLPLQGNPAVAASFVANSSKLMFFPPYLAPLHLLSKPGKDGKWLFNLYNALITEGNQSEKENYFNLIDDPVPISLDDIITLNSKDSESGDYVKTVETLHSSLSESGLSSLKAIVLPQQFTIVVGFSSAEFDGATVTLSGFPDTLRISGSESQSALLAVSKVTDVTFKDVDGSNKKTYAATFWVESESIFSLVEAEQYCRFDINLSTLSSPDAKRSWERTLPELEYSFCERVLHLPIQSPLGRSALVNGDPVSVEEALFNQAPHLYTDLNEKLTFSPTDLPESLTNEEGKQPIAAQLWNAVQTNKAYIESAATTMENGLSWQTIAKIAAASAGPDANAQNIAGATTATLKVMKAATEIEVRDLETLSKSIQAYVKSVSVFTKGTNGIFDSLKDKVKVFELPAPWTNLMKTTGKFYSDVGDKALTAAEFVMTTTALVNAYKEENKADKQFDKVLNQYVAIVQQPGKQVISEVENENIAELDKRVIDNLKAYLERVQADGTQVITAKAAAGKSLVELRTTTFAFDRAENNNQAVRESLKELGGILSQLRKPIPLTVKGYTCSRGSIEYNQNLSLQRAEYVRDAILSGITANKPVWENAIAAIGLGETSPIFDNTSEENRKKNRRADLILHFEAMFDYPMSRGSIPTVEKSRQVSIAKKMDLDDAAIGELEAALDITFDAIGKTGYGLAAKLIYHTLKEGKNIFSNISDLLNENADSLKVRSQLERIQHQNFVTLDKFLSSSLNSVKDEMKMSYLKRAHALNGLLRLLLEVNYQELKKKDGDNSKKTTTTVTAIDIEDYIRRFLLKDNWVLNSNGFGKLHLDEFFMQEKHKQYDSTGLPLLQAKTYTNYAQLGASLLINAIDDDNGTTESPFQSYCPVHYRASKSAESLIDMLKIPFTTDELNYLYGGAKQSIMVRTFRTDNGNSADWMLMKDFIDKYKALSPFDEIRIAVVLDNKSVKNLDKEKQSKIHRVGIEAQAHWNRFNHSTTWGVAIDGDKVVSTSSEYITDISKLLKPEEIEYLNKDNKFVVENSPVFGVIIEPSFVIGVNKINGTRPWTEAGDMWLDSLFNTESSWFSGKGERRYTYEYHVGVKGVENSFAAVDYDSWGLLGISSFGLSLSPSRLYLFDNNKDNKLPKTADHLLVHKGFIDAEMPTITTPKYPPVFEGAELDFYLLQRGISGEECFYQRYYNGQVSNFDWTSRVTCLAVVKAKHFNPQEFAHYGFEQGKVIGINAKITETANFVLKTKECLVSQFTELYRLGTIFKENGEYHFEQFKQTDGNLPELSSKLNFIRTQYEKMSSEELEKHMLQGVFSNDKTDIYAQVFVPEYINVVGSKVEGLEPLTKVESLLDKVYSTINLKLDIVGPYGSKLATDNDNIELDLYSFKQIQIPKVWYQSSNGALEAANEVLSISKDLPLYEQREIAKKYNRTYPDIEPAIKWVAARDNENQQGVSDAQLKLLNEWISGE